MNVFYVLEYLTGLSLSKKYEKTVMIIRIWVVYRRQKQLKIQLWVNQ